MNQVQEPGRAIVAHLVSPLRLGRLTVRNRLYRAPVLEGAGNRPDPAAAYRVAFEPNARAGVGLVIQGNTIVRPGGETAPGMTVVATATDLLRLRPMIAVIHRHGAAIVLQVGHGGLFALGSWDRRRRTTADLIAPSPPPWWLRPFHPGAHVLSEREVLALADRFGRVAAWAREAGYDGVQLASANAKLLHQFLSPIYNRRRDAFGGTPHRRWRILEVIRDRIARHAGPEFPVLVKVPVEDHPAGISFAEGLALARWLADRDFAAITPVYASHLPSTAICRGAYPAAAYRSPGIRRAYLEATGARLRYLALRWANLVTSHQYPFTPVWNRTLFRAVRAAVGVPVFAVGGIRSRTEIDAILAGGEADMVGLGRPFYAEPELPRRLLAGDPRPAACRNCNRCVPPQMLGFKGGCYTPTVRRHAQRLGAQVALL